MNPFVYYSHTQNIDAYIQELEQHFTEKVVCMYDPRILETMLNFYLSENTYTPQHHHLVHVVAEGLSTGWIGTGVSQAHQDGYVFLTAVAKMENIAAFDILTPITQFLLHQHDAVGVMHEQLRFNLSERQRARIQSELPCRNHFLRKI